MFGCLTLERSHGSSRGFTSKEVDIVVEFAFAGASPLPLSLILFQQLAIPNTMLQLLLHSLAYLLASPLPRLATKPGHTGPAEEPERPSHKCRGVDTSDLFGLVTIIFQLTATIITAKCTLRSVPHNKHPRTTIEPAVELLLADMHSTNPQLNALPPRCPLLYVSLPVPNKNGCQREGRTRHSQVARYFFLREADLQDHQKPVMKSLRS